MIQPILAEEGLVLEYKQRHAPMARIALIGLVLGNLGGKLVAALAHRGVNRAGIKARLGSGIGEVIAFVPSIDLARPDLSRSRVASRRS